MIELGAVPALVDAVMVAAFEGWNDAGDAASGAADHLGDVLGALPVGEVDPEDFYDYQVNRPLVGPDDDGVRRITWPTTRVLVARVPVAGGGRRDVVVVQGIEPNMRWRAFCADLVGFARRLGVRRVVTLGALLSDSPHTRPVPVTTTSSDAGLRRELGVEESAYEGPTGIVGVLADACDAAGLPAVSVWAAVPHYAAQPPCPKATLALLRRAEGLLGVPVPLAGLEEDAREWEAGMDELTADDEEVAEYVRHLEEQRDSSDLPEATGEAIAREFEQYLRRRREG